MPSIYTRSGDSGTTGLADGTRTSKTSLRIEAIGTVDECNANLGLLINLLEDRTLEANLLSIQHQLFDLGAVLAGSKNCLIDSDYVTTLENWIDQLDQALPTLTQFILPSGSAAAAQAHITRAVCRRTERCMFAVAANETVPKTVLQYLNRLSDYLFVVARTLAVQNGGDIFWARPEERNN